MRITIDITPDELAQFVASLAPTNNCHNHDRKHICSTVTAPALIETARKLDKAIEETKTGILQTPVQTGTITTTTTVKPTVDNLSTDAKPQKKREGNLAAYKTSVSASSEPQTSVNVPSVQTERNWSVDETSLLRTCQTVDDAKFVYRSHFGDARNDSAITQKWHKMNKAGQLLKVGDKVTPNGGAKEGEAGEITKFTDDRKCATVRFSDDTAMYQIGIEKLERAE